MKIVIVGGDAAGMSAASQVRRLQADWEILVLERGRFASYAACGIPYWLAGDVDSPEQLIMVSPQEFREKRRIDVRTGWNVTRTDAENRTVVARGPAGRDETFPYDRLLLATGGRPVSPAWRGLHFRGVHLLRDLEDGLGVKRTLHQRPRKAVVIGAGYAGLEMAEAMRRRGLAVTVIEKSNRVLAGASAEATRRVSEELVQHEVELRLETTVTGLAGADGSLSAVETSAGPIEAQVALVAIGVKPNTDLARMAGARLGTTGAIKVDERMATSLPDVFAAGDCTEVVHLVSGQPAYVPLALTANRQGRVAGVNIADGDERFSGVVGSAVTKVFDLVLSRTGLSPDEALKAGFDAETVSVEGSSRAKYYPGSTPVFVSLTVERSSGRILGAEMAGRDPSLAVRIDLFAMAATFGLSANSFSELDFAYAPPFGPVWEPALQAAYRARQSAASS